MKKLKGIRPAYCLMVCVSLFLTACGGSGIFGRDGISDSDSISERDGTSGENSISGEGAASYIEPDREWVYVPEVFTVDSRQYVDYERMQPVGDTLCYVSRGEDTQSGVKSICRFSLADGGFQSVPIHWPEGGNDWEVGSRFFTQDQGLYMTANVYSAGSGMKRFLCKIDSEGNCLFSRDITEQAGRNVSLHGLIVDGQGRSCLYLDNGEILLYTGEGEYHGSVGYRSSDSQVPAQVRGACVGTDGGLYICVGRERVNIAEGDAEGTDSVRCALMEIDFENVRLLEIAGNLPNINGLCRESSQGSDSVGQYDLLLYDEKAVYGYRFDTKSDSESPGEELFRWMESDVNGYCVKNLYLLEDGRLCATVVDWMNDDRVIVALKRTRAEQAPKREELVLATVDGGSDLATMAVRFNRGNSRYHLSVKSYDSLTDLYNAVLTKAPIDLIDLSGVNVRKLVDRGLFEDLAPYVDRSEVFERSDFVEGILDAYTWGDTLTGIPVEFMIRTVVGNGAKLNNKGGLTLEELYSIEDRYPGTKAFDGVTREEMMQYIMMFHEDVFIDWDTGVCHFDSEEFQAVLQYVSQFPEHPAGGREEESEVLFAIKEASPYVLWDCVKKFGEDAACVGFPSVDGRGGHLLISSDAYAIASVSKHKESAWAFIEDSLTQDRGELYAELWLTWPALKKTLAERVEVAMDRERFTWDDVNTALKLVPHAMPFFSVKDDEIIKIINEEAGAYYSGQKGAGDVVSVIQNRIQLYVDESF